MTKSELIEAIAARGELTKARAELVVNCVFDAMTEALKSGSGIEIRGFGSFTVRPYKPYAGRNPRTGNPVPVSAKRLPFFKVGKELKELVDRSRGDDEPLVADSDDAVSHGIASGSAASGSAASGSAASGSAASGSAASGSATSDSAASGSTVTADAGTGSPRD